ncbi:hypothetical protein BMS3Abin05_00343 [bacterium BMS3Abin05]|nr:hypothetical protein BMS3Abin05_00343 [bacterium BMS3Abin05]GBE27291.1 hypothetical protein BMS3Bbin03_01215 [bacterium BMS3Bbin03]HDZ12227.1 DUF362 domain-containing protein [Bacteroidota bacterium]
MEGQTFHLSPVKRRQFLKGGLLFAGQFLLDSLDPFKTSASSHSSRVVIVQSDSIRAGGLKIHKQIVREMLETAMQNLFPGSPGKTVWKTLFSPKDVVAVKLNCLAGKGLSPHPELVEAIVAGLKSAGIPERHIILFDRLNEDLKRAGFKINRRPPGVICLGNDSAGYDPELIVYRSIGSLMSRVLTNYATAIINVPVLKDHGIVGFSGGMKNFFGVIHNPNKYHLNVGDPYVPDLSSYPLIKNKLRLIIFDAVNAQYDGGPPYIPRFAWPFNGLIAAADPVAVDYVGWQIIEEKRHEKGLPPLKAVNREPKYIFTAADSRHRLGTANPDQIQIIYKKVS